MADYLAETGNVEPVIVDNGSTYPPLLEYYAHCPHKVEQMGKNYGCTVVWHPESYIKDKYNLTATRYIVTDSDLDLSGIPTGFLHLLELGLDRYKWAWKAGFSLEINDLPPGKVRDSIIQWESDKWLYPLDRDFYRAYIDTTFCLCRAFVHDFAAVRTARPYTARHVPWYYTPDNIPDDERYYLQTAGQWSTFSTLWRETYNVG